MPSSQDTFVLTAYELRQRTANGGSARPSDSLLGVFRSEDEANAAVEDGNRETVHLLRMVTADGGRTGWPVSADVTGFPICHDIDSYLRVRGLMKLSAEEQSALSIARSRARTNANCWRHATTWPAAGVITVHGAYEHVQEQGVPQIRPKLVALFCDDADAERAARDLSDLANNDGRTGAIRAVTLDGGLSCYLLGDEPPLRIWELLAYLAERGRAKLTSEELAALGLAPEPPFPAILTAYEALEVHLDQGIGGCVSKDTTAVGVFVREAHAQQAAKGLCNHEGQNGETRPVRVLTIDGRTGWRVPLGQYQGGSCKEVPAAPVWHGIDAYLRERARARLTAGERLAILPPVEPETGGAQAAPLAGLVTLYQAIQTAQPSKPDGVGYFVDQADAERAAKGSDASGEVKEVLAVTLDGRSAWVLGGDGSTAPVTLWRDVEAHLRHRALARLGDEERLAWGLSDSPIGPSPAQQSDPLMPTKPKRHPTAAERAASGARVWSTGSAALDLLEDAERLDAERARDSAGGRAAR